MLLSDVAILLALASWPLGVLSVPIGFECAWRHAAQDYAHTIQPAMSPENAAVLEQSLNSSFFGPTSGCFAHPKEGGKGRAAADGAMQPAGPSTHPCVILVRNVGEIFFHRELSNK